jgi:hypothetical protein
MVRLTLSQIRARSKGYFFSRNTMKFFRGAKYSTRYDKKTDTNYVKVVHKPPQCTTRTTWYKFNEATGTFNVVPTDEIPF